MAVFPAVGRPSKLDDLVAQRIVSAIADGVSRTGAAKCARIDRATLFDWLARGRNGEEPYADLVDRVREAEGKAEETVVNQLFAQAKKGHVGAMCFWLERRRHQEWGRRDSVVHEHVPGDAQDPATDIDTVRSVLAALESRKPAA